MAKANESWKVLPHRPIERLAENLWRVEGDLAGMPLKRVMTLAKRSDGGVVVHNAMALEEAAMRDLEAWGRPAYLVVPNGYHRLDAKVFKRRYPELKVLCPRGARAAVEQVVAVDGVYEDFPKDDAVRLETLEGLGEAEGVMVVTSADGVTLVLNDAVFNMPHAPGFSGFVLRYVTASTGGPTVSRVSRWFVVKDKVAFRRALERLADTPDLKRVIVSHHEMISADPAGTLRRVASAL